MLDRIDTLAELFLPFLIHFFRNEHPFCVFPVLRVSDIGRFSLRDKVDDMPLAERP
jgi:hypothetical protein